MKAFACAWALLWIAVSRESTFSQEVKVDGYVHNSQGKGISGVKVSLYASGKKDPIDTARTDEDGYYKFDRRIDSTYDMWFSHSQMDFAIIELLAENKNQHINLKLYKRGEKRSVSSFHESLAAVERLLVMIHSVAPADRSKLFDEQKASGAMDLIYSKEMPLSASPSDILLQFLNDKREMLRKLDRDARAK